MQITLRWLFERNIRTVPKTTHKSRMTENINIFDFQLAGEEIEAITAMNTYVRTGESPDEFFETGTF